MGVLRVLGLSDLRGLLEVQRTAWGKTDLELLPVHLLKAVSDGRSPPGIVLGYTIDDRPCGYLIAFHTKDPDVGYMHQVAVVPSEWSKGIGHELMSEMMTIFRDRKVKVVRWTYDPLAAANAALFIGKMGGIGERYMIDHYGRIESTLYGQLATDRLEVTLYLDRAPRTAPRDREIEVPDDFWRLKDEDPTSAGKVRQRTRKEFTDSLSDGYTVTGFAKGTRGCRYQLSRVEP